MSSASKAPLRFRSPGLGGVRYSAIRRINSSRELAPLPSANPPNSNEAAIALKGYQVPQ